MATCNSALVRIPGLVGSEQSIDVSSIGRANCGIVYAGCVQSPVS